MKKTLPLAVLATLLLTPYFLLLAPNVYAQTPVPWPMAGANPQRTSWVNSTVPGNIATIWVKPIPPYVPQHVQVIGAENKVFVSTAGGLYAFDANTGADSWQYATTLPLGHSPTYSNGFLYVGGLDRKLHKLNATNGQPVWTFVADGGFSSNPIVMSGKVYATNRDGALYAINDTASPTLAWKFQTGNNITQSPAFADNTLYFASNDGYAYAVNANNGTQVWKSQQKLPSKGFFWWPVIHQNDVIFNRTTFGSGRHSEDSDYLLCTETSPTARPVGCSKIDIYPGKVAYNVPGPWVSGMATMDYNQEDSTTSSVNFGLSMANYYERFPHYRNVYFYNRATGQERPFDIDNDGTVDAPPLTWSGDQGTPFPPIVSGFDNTIYFRTLTKGTISGFGSRTIVGWNIGTAIVSLPYSNMVGQSGFWPGDETMGFSAAGSKIFWNLCCDRFVGALDISLPNTDFENDSSTRQWRYINSGGLPGFPFDNIGMPGNYYLEAVKYFWHPPTSASFWNENDKPGPAPYNGKLYVILGNALVAFGSGGAGTNAPLLPSAPNLTPPPATAQPTTDQLIARLEQEVQEIVAAGHLKPSLGYDLFKPTVEDNLDIYWHNSGDTFRVLTRALPFLSTNLQTAVRTYLQSEMINFSPAKVANITFNSGVQRDSWPYPPEETLFHAFDMDVETFPSWGFPPYNIYVLWKMAENRIGCSSPSCTPASMAQVYLNDLENTSHDLNTPITANKPILTNDYLRAFPNLLNAFIAGFKGQIELKKLAGQPLSPTDPFVVEYDRLLNLRVNQSMVFPDPQTPWMTDTHAFESFITYYNFAYMTRELADYLVAHSQPIPSDPNQETDTLRILQRYQDIAPNWMDVHNGATQGEFTRMPYQQTHTMFQALAMVKKAPQSELVKYLDSPIVPVGDLYYIDNLVAVLEASSSGTPTPTSSPQQSGDIEPSGGDGDVDLNDYQLLLGGFGTANCSINIIGSPCQIDIFDFNVLLGNFGS